MINLNQLTFGYWAKQPVLQNLTLEILPGHIYGLLGRNGAGKSSLLHQLCGLLFPDSGVCSVNGMEPKKRSPAFLQDVYLLPEEVALPNISILNYLQIYAPFYPNFNHEKFYDILKEFEVPVTNKLQGMSLGQKKKVAISFALATQARVLLFDEPTNGLDIPSKRQFRRIIAGIVQDDQVIIISTHQVRDLDNLIDHVWILDEQKIILNQSIENITEKLAFKQVMNVADVALPLYTEGGLKGYAVVAVNTMKEQSKFDMEMFFNAVLAEKQQILSQFN